MQRYYLEYWIHRNILFNTIIHCTCSFFFFTFFFLSIFILSDFMSIFFFWTCWRYIDSFFSFLLWVNLQTFKFVSEICWPIHTHTHTQTRRCLLFFFPFYLFMSLFNFQKKSPFSLFGYVLTMNCTWPKVKLQTIETMIETILVRSRKMNAQHNKLYSPANVCLFIGWLLLFCCCWLCCFIFVSRCSRAGFWVNFSCVVSSNFWSYVSRSLSVCVWVCLFVVFFVVCLFIWTNSP